jgi:hypothetical protein
MGEVTFWNFRLVNTGVEHIRVIREKTILYDGVVPAGFSMHLTVGDKVLYRIGTGRWRKKFALIIRKGHPYIKFGETYGPLRDQPRAMNPMFFDKRRLSFAGLLNTKSGK